jgi:hypothetical protein
MPTGKSRGKAPLAVPGEDRADEQQKEDFPAASKLGVSTFHASIAELALVRAAEPGVDDPVREFWAATLRLRDLLKFEFFFADKEKYERDPRAEVALHDREWETRIAGGPNGVLDTARRIRPYTRTASCVRSSSGTTGPKRPRSRFCAANVDRSRRRRRRAPEGTCGNRTRRRSRCPLIEPSSGG